MSGFVVLANAGAGSVTDDALGRALAVLARRGPVEVVEAGSAPADEALRDRERVVVVAGGDGTVHAVVQRAYELGLFDGPGPGPELGLIPLGTGNDLARGSGIPLDPAEAAERATTGEAVPLDVALVAGTGDRHVVANCSHAGAGAVAALTADRWKPRLGRLAYPAGAVGGAWRATPFTSTVTVDGSPVHEGPVALLVVANGPTIGGGTPAAPGARPDDGLLDVVVVPARSTVAMARLGLALRTGRHVDLPDVVVARGAEVAVAGEPARWNEDGEVGDATPSWRATVLPAAWSLRGARPGRA